MDETNELSEALLNFREKRKWQIALRRYLLKGHRSTAYAPYFGLDIQSFRKWIELQFDDDTSWENFGETWQLDHIIPVGYFDFKNEEDLRLCWNFLNIRVEKSELNKARGNRVDVLTAKAYFQDIFSATALPICRDMIRKIEQIEISQIVSNNRIENFILENLQYFASVQTFTSYEFEQLNMGVSFEEIQLQRDILSKYSK
ncbi:MAG: hypothetical protein JNK79_15430 [Chitinophagaceae bacterium]|nr:hypothetical protein [Chitinophagaceae bacterium]